MNQLTFLEVDALLTYDPDTGKLWWKERDEKLFATRGRCRFWNKRFAGKEAFTAIDGDGYRHGAIHHKTYFAHRVIWLLHSGSWPSDQVDHVNGIRSDNRIANLRAVSRDENQKNRRPPSNNTSGVVGVGWCKREGKYTAQIKVNKRTIQLGYFDEFDDAVRRRKAAEVEHGFHVNHGRSA